MVGIELHHDVPIGADLLNVTALRVVGVYNDAVPGSCTLGQNVHVIAVEMDRVTVG